MTELTLPSAYIRDGITTLTRDLNAAIADADQFERLKNAAGNVLRIRRLVETETKLLEEAIADEAKTEREATLAKIRNLRVTTEWPAGLGTGMILSAKFTIHCEELAWDMNEHANVWKSTSYDGFNHLPISVTVALYADLARLLPSIILDLAPSDPETALERYMTARQRGYVRR